MNQETILNKIHILAIAPYEGMAQTLLSINNKRTDVEIDVRLGNLRTGLDIAREMLDADHYDVILSRGGTAELLRSKLDIPVSEVQFSVYDLLRCIKMAENYGEQFAIAGFSALTGQAKTLLDLLQLNVKIVTFHSQEEAPPLLEKLKKQRISLVICDLISMDFSRSLGLNTIFVPSGEESINEAIDTAIGIYYANYSANRDIEVLKRALINDNEYITIYDENGELWFSNSATTGFDSHLMLELNAAKDEYLSLQNKTTVRRIGGTVLKIVNRTVSYGNDHYIMLRFSLRPVFFEDEDKTVSIYDASDEEYSDYPADMNSSNLVGKTHVLLDRYSESTLPVLIAGERGTGKRRAAFILYKSGRLSKKPYYEIDCSLITEKKWNSLLNNENSPLNEVGVTIHIKDVDRLSNKELGKLYDYINDSSLLKRCRIIFSMVVSDDNASALQEQLYNSFSCLLLLLTPLRQRKEDIPGIATLYINQMNLRLGRQIVGFDSPAMELVKNYRWSENLDQFQRVLKELMLITDTPYITAESVKTVLQQEDRINPGGAAIRHPEAIDLSRPLHDIENEIVKLVLSEENMNREKTAKRLNISRSTLWRMLKNQTEK